MRNEATAPTASCNDKNKAANDKVFAFTGAGIPLDKVDQPLMCAWLEKYTTIACRKVASMGYGAKAVLALCYFLPRE